MKNNFQKAGVEASQCVNLGRGSTWATAFGGIRCSRGPLMLGIE